jgi:hypothetical protein
MRAIFCIAVVFDIAAFFSLSLRAGDLEPVNYKDDPWEQIDEGEDDDGEPASDSYTIQLHNEEYWTHGDVAI